MSNVYLEGATPRQRVFIENLMAERSFSTETDVVINSPSEASSFIKTLLKTPKKLETEQDSELLQALSSIPKSKYAIPLSETSLDLVEEVINSEYLFVEVREYQKTLQLRRLTGSVGSFVRSRLSISDSLLILSAIASNPYKYARLFGEVYACCGKCGAELTDDTSRSMFLGPVCRKSFGF